MSQAKESGSPSGASEVTKPRPIFVTKAKEKAEINFFYEDVVYRVGKRGLDFGMVVENSEFASSDEDDDQKDEPPLKIGYVRVAWHPDGDESVVNEKRIYLADRSLMPGDVVRRLIKGRETQRGCCRSIKVLGNLQIVGTDQIIYGVSSELLEPLVDFSADVAVCMDSWVGMLREVKFNVVVKFSDGSLCCIPDSVADKLTDLQDKRDPSSEFGHCSYFEGQLLSGRISCFQEGHFTHQTIEMSKMLDNPKVRNKFVNVIVTKVETVSLRIQWQCQGSLRGNPSSERPPPLLVGDDIKKVKMLNVYEPCSLQIGDQRFYKLREDDVIMSKEKWKLLEVQSMSEVRRTVTSNKEDVIHPKDVSIEASCCRVEDISDEDDEKQRLLKTKKLKKKRFPFTGSNNAGGAATVGQTLFRTRGQNRKKKLKPSKQTAGSQLLEKTVTSCLKPGEVVVVEAVSTRSEATVIWQNGDVDRAIPSWDLYPILYLDDHEFFCGDFVVKNVQDTDSELANPQVYGIVETVDHFERTCFINWFRAYSHGQDPNPGKLCRTEEPVFNLKEHPDFRYRLGSVVVRLNESGNSDGEQRAVAGQVMDIQQTGKVLVWWADGKKSLIWPQELYKIGDYDSDDGELWEDETGSSDEGSGTSGESSWETESEHSVHEEDNEADKECVPGFCRTIPQEIEKALSVLSRLEDCVNKLSPTVHMPTCVIKNLLSSYTACTNLDKFMGTTFFQEENLEGLIGEMKHCKGVRSSHWQAMTDQVKKLFSDTSTAVQDGTEDEDQNGRLKIFGKLCSLLKTQLLKAQEEFAKRLSEKIVAFKHEGLTSSPFEGLKLEEVAGHVLFDEQSRENSHANSNKLDADAIQITDLSSSVSNSKITKEGETKNSSGSFSTLEFSPIQHKFHTIHSKNVMKFVRKEIELMRASLPRGIHVKGFEDRMDLYSVMIEGPASTPYEDGLFFFDFQLPTDYPFIPPKCHYHSYVNERLNPNLYENGTVCLSLLGTWSGKGTETWTSNSNMLQILVSIQGLVLVSEPYYNEAGYERQKGTQQGSENSRMYNEMVLLKLIQGMTRQAKNPPQPFKCEVEAHFRQNTRNFIGRIESWRAASKSCCAPDADAFVSDAELPEFPLLPASKGFWMTMNAAIENLKKLLSDEDAGGSSSGKCKSNGVREETN